MNLLQDKGLIAKVTELPNIFVTITLKSGIKRGFAAYKHI